MIEYRQAQLRDAEAVALLHARSWRENYRGAFTDAFLDGDLPGERLRVWRERLAVQQVLESLGGKISAGTMRKINAQLDRDKRRPEDVAREFLKSQSF